MPLLVAPTSLPLGVTELDALNNIEGRLYLMHLDQFKFMNAVDSAVEGSVFVNSVTWASWTNAQKWSNLGKWLSYGAYAIVDHLSILTGVGEVTRISELKTLLKGRLVKDVTATNVSLWR